MLRGEDLAEHQAGILCEKGFMKERYDGRVDELIRRFTPKGIKVVKGILEEEKYQKIFMQILYKEIRDLPEDTQRGVVQELKHMLASK